MNKPIACIECKYGTMSIIVSEEQLVNKEGTSIANTYRTRKCPSCGATMKTYTLNEHVPPLGNTHPPLPFTPEFSE